MCVQDADSGPGAAAGPLPARLQPLLQGGLCRGREGPLSVVGGLLPAAGLRPGPLLLPLGKAPGRSTHTRTSMHTCGISLIKRIECDCLFSVFI